MYVDMLLVSFLTQAGMSVRRHVCRSAVRCCSLLVVVACCILVVVVMVLLLFLLVVVLRCSAAVQLAEASGGGHPGQFVIERVSCYSQFDPRLQDVTSRPVLIFIRIEQPFFSTSSRPHLPLPQLSPSDMELPFSCTRKDLRLLLRLSQSVAQPNRALLPCLSLSPSPLSPFSVSALPATSAADRGGSVVGHAGGEGGS